MIKWTEDLSIGIETIDRQHQELFNRINSLVEAIRESQCKYKIGDVISFLEDYVHTHFEEEERFMTEYRYPYYDFHKGQHEYFKRELMTLKPELLKLEGGKNPGSYELSLTTNQLVVDWILEHVSQVDKELGKFLKKNI